MELAAWFIYILNPNLPCAVLVCCCAQSCERTRIACLTQRLSQAAEATQCCLAVMFCSPIRLCLFIAFYFHV